MHKSHDICTNRRLKETSDEAQILHPTLNNLTPISFNNHSSKPHKENAQIIGFKKTNDGAQIMYPAWDNLASISFNNPSSKSHKENAQITS